MTSARKDLVPADAPARTRAASDLAVSMALQAGAGSGKTSVLTERIVRLLESGAVAPRELAAMTFTEKAAGEILSRVRDALERRLERATDAERGRLEDVLARFGELTLTTIHAFCREVLSLESLEADFAPDSEIGADDAAADLMARVVDGWLDTLRTSAPALWRLAERLCSEYALRTAAKELDRYREHADVIAEGAFDLLEAHASLHAALDELDDAERACMDPDDKLLTYDAATFAELRTLAQDMNDDALTAILLLTPKTHKSWGSAKAWGGAEGKARAQAARAALITWHKEWRERAHAALVRSLRAHVLPAYDDARRRASIATFDDLLRDAARLLRTSADARRRLAARWRVLLVDEVQDTDPVQAEVATLLTRAHDEDGPWRDAKAAQARLFVVGDPKQSIYRFRGADVSTFTHLQSVVKRNGAVEALTQNFRSVPGIVRWVNAVFHDLLDYAPQVAHRAPAALDPVVLLEGSEAVGEIEAAVRHLKQLLDAGARVVDRDSGELRPLKKSDVMFLLPAWRSAEAIAERLRAVGIDCVVEGGDTFFARDEVRLGLAALRAIVEPADTEAVAFLLRGLFGLSHVELAAHVAPRADGARGSLRFTVPGQPPGPVADALAVLAKLHRGRGARSLAGLLDELFAHTRALAVWKLLPDGASRLANLDKLAALVRQAEADTTSPLAAVDALRRLERNVADKDIDRIDKDGDFVRVTSLFKAKGLEAPLVFVLLATRQPSRVRAIVDHAAGTVAVKLGALAPPDWDARKESEKLLENAERRRFMYVAATRARDQLVVCRPAPRRVATADGATVEKPRQNDLLSVDISARGLPAPDACAHAALWTLGAGPDAATVRVFRADALPEADASDETFPHHDGAVDALLAAPPSTGDPDGDAWRTAQHNATRAATRGCVRWRQASGEPGESGWKPGTTVDEAPQEERVGARGGRVIHAVMERLDLAEPHEECVARAHELVHLLGVQAALPDDMIARCATILERILKNPLVESARRAPERWHEVPFTFSPRPGTVVSGTIDLAFPLDQSKKTWAVFDWKSRVPAPEDKLRARYEEQLERYANALVRTLGDARVVQKEIVGPYPELGDVGGLDDVFADVNGALKRPLADLLARGAPAPLVGADVGDAMVSAELAWPDLKLAVLPDARAEDAAALVAEGWRVHATIDEETAVALGVPARAEDA